MPSESRRLQARGSAAAAMRALHVFAPSSEEIYVIATSLSDPCLVIDRRTGLCRVAPPAELVSLIGPAGNRAPSIPLQAVVGIVSFPDDKALIIVTESQRRGIVTERGPGSIAAISKTIFLQLKPESERGNGGSSHAGDQWQWPWGSAPVAHAWPCSRTCVRGCCRNTRRKTSVPRKTQEPA